MDKKDKERVMLDAEELDMVSGGYSQETWNQMSPDERKQAYQVSKAYRTLGQYCAYDDKTV